MDWIDKALSRLDREAEDLVNRMEKRGGTDDNDLRRLDWISHAMKSLECVAEMREGESASRGWDASREGGGGTSGRRGRSRTTGRYVSRDGDGGGSWDGASGGHDSDKQRMIEAARQFLREVED